MEKISDILSHFQLDGKVSCAKPINSGHINTTFRVTMDNGEKYTLQSINTYVFHEPHRVMENILAVTSHVRQKLASIGEDPERGCLNVVLTRDNQAIFVDDEGKYWRVYRFIDRARTYDVTENEMQMYQAGWGFGRFQRMLSDFDMGRLHDTIPDFHNTKKRMEDFFEAVGQDKTGRAKDLKEEIAFFEQHYDDAVLLCNMQEEQKIPLRVTHNDTKVNNILIDEETDRALCVIDLDTVMPGLAALDFGDAIRFAANTAVEDERDLSKVDLNLSYYESYTRGFLNAVGNNLTETELAFLPHGATVITIELASRFLADYLNGDVYFKIHRKEHNLDRARCQIQLVRAMEQQFETMCRIAAECRTNS